MTDFLLTEGGFHILLEDGSGALETESLAQTELTHGNSYLLTQDGFHILLQDGLGAIIIDRAQILGFDPLPNDYVVSQPQLNRMNSILRGIRDTRNMNLEVYSIAYDISNLYYKQGVINTFFEADVETIYVGNFTPMLWDHNIIYDMNDRVFWKHVWYHSIIDNNHNHAPDVSPSQWTADPPGGDPLSDSQIDTRDVILPDDYSFLTYIVDLTRRLTELESDIYSDL